MRFRQVHLDFHTNATIPGIGSRFDAKAFGKAFKDAYVDSVTVFSKCHHGVSYHPTEVGKMHPHLTFDLLRAQIDALHAVGINAPVYLTATWDELAAFEHPEWRTVSPDGSLPVFRPEYRQWRRLGLPRLFDALSRLPRGADRGGDGQLSRCRRHLHGHLVPAAVDLVVGAGPRWRRSGSTGRTRATATSSPRSRSRTTSPASAMRCKSTIRKCRCSSTRATCDAACASTIPTTTPTSSSRACRPPAGVTSISR